MRPLTEEVQSFARLHSLATSQLLARIRSVCIGLQETRAVFEKLHKFLGKNIQHLVDRKDESYVFRLQRNRVLYVRENIMRRATNVSPLCCF